jgi:hypothetical protein
MFFGYNRKVAKTTYPCLVQPPQRISIMMELLSHYHCEIYCCKPVPMNLHQITYTNKLNHAPTCISNCTINKCINHAPTCTKKPAINMYHKQVHQPCTKPVQITCHNNLSQQIGQTTYHNNLSHQSYQPNQIYSPRSITKTNLKDVHQPSITKQLIIITKINMCL